MKQAPVLSFILSQKESLTGNVQKVRFSDSVCPLSQEIQGGWEGGGDFSESEFDFQAIETFSKDVDISS